MVSAHWLSELFRRWIGQVLTDFLAFIRERVIAE